ncbi:SusC/RagA family TonB-linked outer membrane protein [Pontibacter locisalis]|uniref:SusC/RagA family TonB-linked outer membrane protein n=1 Tax=Pontibacter locisalis TaxID=1719035 RepID=A0ABW5IJB9_9BACT
MRKLLLMSFVLMFTLLNQVVAQSKTVSGTVTDQTTSQGLPGVAVIVKGTTVGTTTGADGSYSINVPAGSSTLVFRFIGYQTIEKSVGNAGTINVALATDQKLLDEVVVVGYGTQLKKDVTSSISQVKGSEIANIATPSFDQQLAGRATGVQVTQPSGILGAAPTIRIRGVNSITGGNSPLIVVDGVPAFSGNAGGFTPANTLGDINPADIESFEILKDGAATAIYGSRASNGVILITTKKGKTGQVRFNYDNYVGVAEAVKLYDLLDAKQFVEISNEKYAAIGSPAQAFMDSEGTNTNWNDYVFRSALQQNHVFSASAGTDKTKYYVSLGYSNQEGIARPNELTRYTFRSNLDQQVTEWLNFGISAGLTSQKNEGPLTGSNNLSGNTFAVMRQLPNVKVYNPEDPTGYNIDASDRRSLGRGANLITISDGIPNLRFVLDNNVRRAVTYRGLGNAYLDAKIIDNLRFKTLIGIDASFADDFSFTDPRHGDGYSSSGTLTQAFSPAIRWNWQNILSYSKSFNDVHNFDVTAVAEYTKTRSSFLQAGASGLSDRFFSENLISGTYANQFADGGLTENGLASYLGRINYNYKSKYYLGASVRADGLSKLPEEGRWGYFPAVSFAWRVSEEAFFKNSDALSFINDLRIRGSFAEVGNTEITGGNYPYIGSFSSAQYGSQNGISYSNIFNPNLKWESQKIYDAGIDLSVLDGRMNFVVAYWRKDNFDNVLGAPTAPSLGLPDNRVIKNIGNITNSGFEFSLNSTVIDKGAFTWTSNFNFSTQRNEVTKLVDGQDIFNTYTIVREGESINSLFGYTYKGVNNANGNPIYQKADGTLVQGNITNNTYYVYDPANPSALTTKSSLTAADKSILGSALPTWFGGFDNQFRYGNFDLGVFFRYSGGNLIMNRTRQDLLSMNFVNNGTEILNRWQSPEKPGDGQTPRLEAGNGGFINRDNETLTRFVEKGDYLKLSNVMLGYNLPTELLNKTRFNKARVFAQVQNALTFTEYSGLDPETNTGIGVDFNGNPQQRVYTVGVNIGF